VRSFLTPLVDADAGAFVLRNARTRGVVASELLPAFDSKSRQVGLLGRESLPPLAAMLIAPTNAIHTFFMKFPIDVIFVAKDGRVVKIRSALRAWRLSACLRGHAVIEMAADTVARTGTIVGDRLTVEPR